MKVILIAEKQNFLLKKCYVILSRLAGQILWFKSQFAPLLVDVRLHEDSAARLPPSV
jgi:hypothetical protein